MNNKLDSQKIHELTRKSQFNYYLPDELIAQFPLEPRDSSRLMILEKESGKMIHDHFYNLPNYLSPKDCIILNDSRVMPARILGKNVATQGIVEFLLLKQREVNMWETLVKPGKKAKIGFKFIFGTSVENLLCAEVTEILEDGNRIIKFEDDENFFSKLEKIGTMPLPPYIKQKLEDQSRYQTVYANDLGSAAAPTAGLHFTTKLLEEIERKGVKKGFVTLHVGLGTFRPVKEDEIENHQMHSEHFILPQETVELIESTKKQGGRVISVGTTSCRVLESVYKKYGKLESCNESTDIFIKPGFKFGVIDSLITNFHLPESTLIILVCTFAGYESTLKAYEEAVKERYRFFSFGDAMMII